MKAQPLLKFSGLVFILIVVWYSFYIVSPPQAKPATTPPAEFSAERAFKHIHQISTEPRPLGTAANDSARAYLIRQLRELGLKPMIQEGVGVNSRHGSAGYTRNILAELPGNDSQKTIMLMAHYDSVPVGPGAGDDASGVATILEVLRAVMAGDPFQHDILVLFTDGEERGLLGAELFIDQYTGWEQIDLVINVEARGTGGPSIMFETSVNNSGLIPHFANATTDPVANSLTYTIYRLLPNDTDLSVMKRAGLNGLNYALIDGYLNYHTMQDRPDKLSPASLQHHGENLLANVRYFTNHSFSLDSRSDFVYFNNLTGGIAYYPAGWSFPLAVIVGLVFIVYLVILVRKGKVYPVRYLLGILSYILLLLAGAVITYYGWQFIRWLHPEYQWLVQGETYNHRWYLIGFSALTLALVTGFTGWLVRKLYMNNLLAGIYTLWIILGLVTAWYLPSASYLLVWPALFALVGWIASEPELDDPGWKSSIILWLSLLPALFIISPYIRLIQIAMTTGFIAVSMVLLLLLAGLCLPLIWQIARPRPGYWMSGLATVFLFCIIGAALNSGYDANQKKQNDLMYMADLDQQKAFWLSRDHTTDRWTSQFLGESPSRDTIRLFGNPAWGIRPLLADAPVVPFQPAEIQVRADSSAGSLRYLSLHMYSHEPGLGMHFKMSDGQAFREITLFGRALRDRQVGPELSPTLTHFFYFADQTQPVEVNLVIPAKDSDIGFEITFIRHQLPAALMANFNPRDPYMMPTPYDLSDASIWKKTYWLEDLK